MWQSALLEFIQKAVASEAGDGALAPPTLARDGDPLCRVCFGILQDRCGLWIGELPQPRFPSTKSLKRGRDDADADADGASGAAVATVADAPAGAGAGDTVPPVVPPTSDGADVAVEAPLRVDVRTLAFPKTCVAIVRHISALYVRWDATPTIGAPHSARVCLVHCHMKCGVCVGAFGVWLCASSSGYRNLQDYTLAIHIPHFIVLREFLCRYGTCR